MKFFAESANALAGWSAFLAPAAGKGFVILALVFASMAVWWRSTAAGRHLAWTMTFVCLLCLPIFVRCVPAWRAPVWMVPAALNNGLPDSLSFVLHSQPRSPFQPPAAVSEGASGAHRVADVSRQPAPAKHVVSWRDVAVVIWFAGIMIGLMRLLAVQSRLERMEVRMRTCENQKWRKWIDDLRIEYRIRRPIKLLLSETSASPMTWGFWRPIIALPAASREWPEDRLGVVLRHELAHVKRWDCLTQQIAGVVCALYWFNPLTWLAARRMRAEREKACDDFVLNAGAQPADYAGHLVEIAQQFASANWHGAVAMARPSGLEQRVTAILDGRRNRNRIAKTTAAFIVIAIIEIELLIGGCAKKASATWHTINDPKLAAHIESFVTDKKSQENNLIKADEKNFAKEYAREGEHLKQPDCRPFFSAAAKGDWPAVSNLWLELKGHTFGIGITNAATAKNGGYPHGMWLQPIRETFGAVETFTVGDEKYSKKFGDDIIRSIPKGSIYFGGTDAGRFIITAMQKNQMDGDPFFTLTQNALADMTYLDYVRSMYGEKIYIPTEEDAAKCFREYSEDAARRAQTHQLKPGEKVQVDPQTGRVSISGQVAVMEINGMIAKVVFDKNPNHEFYIEESFPLDWMYPYLEPHGLIFKIDHQPLPQLSEAIVLQDHDYWTKLIQPMIGDWLNDETSVQEIADFAKKVFLRHDFSGFTGDPQFIQNNYTCKMFSKERASIAGLYVWRMNHAADAAERERMAQAADFAFRQALALCPYGPEAVKSYADFLQSRNRDSEAALVENMARQFPKQK